MTQVTRKAALLAAALFLEQNRTKHITGSFALNAQGHEVFPTDPEAECFCALGRYAKERGLVPAEDQGVWDLLWTDLGQPAVNRTYSRNDEDKSGGAISFGEGYEYLAGPAGIQALRELADEVPDDA